MLKLTTEHFLWEDFFWVADVRIASGLIKLTFAPEGRDELPLTDAELRLAQWFIDRESEVVEAGLLGIFSIYGSEQHKYGYDDEEKAKYMPDIYSVADLRKLVNLHSVNIHQISNNGQPYIGLELRCTWDDEHGVGVLLNGTRVVEVGGADTAILLWIAEEDADKQT